MSVDFLARFAASKVASLGDSVTSFFVSLDPETASQVDIDNARNHCRDLATKVAGCMDSLERDNKAVTNLTNQLQDTMRAAHILGDQIQATGQDGNSPLNVKLNKLMDVVQTIGGDEGDGLVSGTLFDANENLKQSQVDLYEWKEIHSEAVSKLTTMETALRNATRDMQHAQEQERRATERQAAAEADAGLRHGLDKTNVALSAMQKRADDAKKNANAAKINAAAIRETSGSNTDDIVAEVLKSSKPVVSALDRLKQMKR